MTCECRGPLGLDLTRLAQKLRAGARLMVGLPDYDSYVSHRKTTHPGEPVMSYREFFCERQEARYGGAGKRGGCC